MGRKKKPDDKPKAAEAAAANLPFSIRLRDDVAEALVKYRELEADRTGWDAPSKPEIIDRALREFLNKHGKHPLAIRPGLRED